MRRYCKLALIPQRQNERHHGAFSNVMQRILSVILQVKKRGMHYLLAFVLDATSAKSCHDVWELSIRLHFLLHRVVSYSFLSPSFVLDVFLA